MPELGMYCGRGYLRWEYRHSRSLFIDADMAEAQSGSDARQVAWDEFCRL